MHCLVDSCSMIVVFFFNDTATTEIYTLSLHDALPICDVREAQRPHQALGPPARHHRAVRQRRLDRRRRGHRRLRGGLRQDRKSTRLNSSHANISYAVFCLKKKTKPPIHHQISATSPPH